MTNQEMFDKAYLGIMTQGKMAVETKLLRDSQTKFLQCYYIADDGSRCGVGHLLPKEVAENLALSNPECSEDGDFRRILSKFGIDPSEEELAFMSRIQKLHDESQSLDDFVTRSALFAEENGLTVPQL